MQSPLTVLAGLLAYVFWHALPFFQRLLRQPVHEDRAELGPVHDRRQLERLALELIADNVRECIEARRLPNGEEKLVLCAGLRNFREPWARDFGFAIFGLIDLQETEVARQNLEVFFVHQLPNGQFPLKVHSTHVLERYLHSLLNRHQPIHSPLRPKYITAHNTTSLDGNGLMVIATLNYAERTGDEEFARERWDQLKRAVDWMEQGRLSPQGLLLQGGFSDWADSINRKGSVLYTNVIYWKALDELARAARRWGLGAEADYHARRSQAMRAALVAHFWRHDLGYFATSRRFDMLASDGNLLAIAWGLADREQTDSILGRMQEFGMADPVPTRVTHRPYPARFVGVENHLAGISHYHTSASWLWLGAWHVIALARAGYLQEAEELLHRIYRVVLRDRVVYEVHDRDGTPLATRWYNSEAPLAWNAAMIIHAAGVVRRRRR